MRRIATILFLLASLQLLAQNLPARLRIASAEQGRQAGKIVVDAEGKGDFKTIQAAINSLPDSSAIPRTIFIKKGTYAEKLFIEKKQYHL
jgi:pectin methylesterase-like acyl-CoA thioesterase